MGVEREEVVHHRATQACYHFPIKAVLALFLHPVADDSDVGQETFAFFFRGMNNGISVETDAASDGKVVGWQLFEKEFVLRGKEFYAQILTCCQIFQLMWMCKNQYVAGTKVKTFLVEHEASFAFQTHHVGTTAIQLGVVNAVKISRIYEFHLLHVANLQLISNIFKRLGAFVKT